VTCAALYLFDPATPKQTARATAPHASRPTKHHAAKSTSHRRPPPRLRASTTPSPIGIPGTWTLVLDSQFNGTSLNKSIWRPGWFGSGTTDPVSRRELDCYSSNNVTLPADGTVHLTVTNTRSRCDGVTKPYTSALLSSNPRDGRASGGFQFVYGALEARVRIPASGTRVADWPSVWMDGQTWPADGEGDIVEGLTGQTCFNFHPTSRGSGGCTAAAYTGWHTFAADREPGSVTYYYDGVKVGQIGTGIAATPMYIVLGIGVTAANPVVPTDMQVAYVRVWRH
jgi:beta-glucanase (GH16 family)